MYEVYSIKCKVTNREYIGKTNNLDVRMKQHHKYVKMSSSDRSHYPLYIDMKENGFDNFTVETIETCADHIQAALREKFYIKERQPFYNTGNGGEGTLAVDENLILEKFEELGNAREVARVTGYNDTTVYEYLEKNGVKLEKNLAGILARKQIQSYELKTGFTINTYDSVADASRDLTGKTTGCSAINKVASGRNYSYKKMGWRYI